MKIIKRFFVLVSILFITLSLVACDKKIEEKPEVIPEVTLTSVTLDQDNINTNRLNLSNAVKPLSVQLDYLLVKKSENVIRLTINLDNPKQHTVLSLKIKDTKGKSKLLDSASRDDLGYLVETNNFNWGSRSNLKSDFLIELDIDSTPNDIEILEILYIDAENNSTIRADLNNQNVSRVYIYDAEIEIDTVEKTLIGTRIKYWALGYDINRDSVEFFVRKGNGAPIKINNVKDNIVYANIFDNEELDGTSYYNLYVKYNRTGELPESEKTVERLLISDFQLVEKDRLIRVYFQKDSIGMDLYKAISFERIEFDEHAYFKIYLEIDGVEQLLLDVKLNEHSALGFSKWHVKDFGLIQSDNFKDFVDIYNYVDSLDESESKVRVEVYHKYNDKIRTHFNGLIDFRSKRNEGILFIHSSK